MKNSLNPNDSFVVGVNFLNDGRIQEAENVFREILKKIPTHTGALTILGSILINSPITSQQGANYLEKSLKIDSNQPLANNNLGAYYLNNHRFKEARNLFLKVIQLNPNFIEAIFNLAKCYRGLGNFNQAIEEYSKCLEFNNEFIDAYNNRGLIYFEELKQYKEAICDFQSYISLAPDSFFGYFNLANAQRAAGMMNDAYENYIKSINLSDNYAPSHNNFGLLLNEIGSHKQAIEEFEIASKIAGPSNYYLSNLFDAKMCVCDWSTYFSDTEEYNSLISNKSKAVIPFHTLLFSDSPEIQLKSAKILADDIIKLVRKPLKPKKHEKIRIGYITSDFYDHPMMHLMSELFEKLDKNKFEQFGISIAPTIFDEWSTRAVNAFNGFYDLHDKSDEEIAEFCRGLELDIAIDRKGYTLNSRPQIFAERCAPIQISYVAYPGTLGAEFIDYIVADKVTIPSDARKFYSESIVYMPDCYLPICETREFSDIHYERDYWGLPKGAFVYCCFNNPNRITPIVFESWMNILSRVPHSVLWLLSGNDLMKENLKNEAKRHGIEADRLIFAERISVAEHLNRIKHADLFLDTLPYNAHTTATDSLRAGVPIITQLGTTFAGRVSASLLTTLGLNELITTSRDEYINLAVKLSDQQSIANVKEKLQKNISSSPLFNSEQYTKALELAFLKIYERSIKRLKPQDIYIDPLE